MPNPVYVTLPEGPLRRSCLEHLDSPVVPAELDQLGRDAAAEPGVVLLDPEEVGLDDLLSLADRLLEGGGGAGWRFAAVRPGHPPRVQVLSVGHPEGLAEVAPGLSDLETHPGMLLELRTVLAEVSRARHDVNNPLTSAMAEAQLLLMDVEDPDVREGLEIVQTQLRRIRDLVAATGHIRPRRGERSPG